jgi:hypothetical protein
LLEARDYMEAGRIAVRDFLSELREPALEKWRQSGGHVIERKYPGEQSAAYREAYVLVLSALALDAQNSALTDKIRERNAGPLKGSGGLGAVRRRAAPVEQDDYSDGSELQARLVEANVRAGKPEVYLDDGVHALTGSNGEPTRRVIVDQFASGEECEMVNAAAVLALAGGFSRNGQSTLGISPALTSRLAPAAAAEGVQHAYALRALYTLVERARRRVVADFGVTDELYVSDAQVARLQPVDDAAAAIGARSCPEGRGHDPWDVGLARADQFCYWRPHIDQVSVRSYDYSALLYLTDHGADFEGGRLVVYDPDADRVVLPRAGRLALFPSGAQSMHAVERVTRGTRFTCTMWFTRSARDSQPDSEQRAWLAWARRCADEDGAQPPPPPPPPPSARQTVEPPLPSRLDALRLSALCTLPAGDPLCHELLSAVANGSVSVEVALGASIGYDPTALADWHSCALDPTKAAATPEAASKSLRSPASAEAQLRADRWLHPRIEACAALMMALTNDAAAGSEATDNAQSKKPRACSAFSVFD